MAMTEDNIVGGNGGGDGGRTRRARAVVGIWRFRLWLIIKEYGAVAAFQPSGVNAIGVAATVLVRAFESLRVA